MKTATYLTAIALIAFPSIANAGEDEKSISKASFKLAKATTVPGLAKKDPYGKRIRGAAPVYENQYMMDRGNRIINTTECEAKVKKSKISNKEILIALVDAGIIPAISGWYVAYIASLVGDGGEYVATNDDQIVGLGNYLWSETTEANSYTKKYKRVDTWTGQELTSTKETGRQSGKNPFTLNYNDQGADVKLMGIQSWKSSLKTFGRGEDAYTRWISGGSKLTSLSGYVNYDGENRAIEGSASLGSAKPLSLSYSF